MNKPINKNQNRYGNENKIRIIALLVYILISIYILKQWTFIPVFLFIDFGCRGFNFTRFSPLSFAADVIIKIFGIGVKPIFLPPKLFAAKLGFVFSALIILLILLNLNTIAISALFGLCAALESFFSICVGCYVFDFLQKIKRYKLLP